MIKDIKDLNGIKLNVFLKDGTDYLGKDIPSRPFGDNERYVAFWVDGAITLIPMDLVKRIEMFNEKQI